MPSTLVKVVEATTAPAVPTREGRLRVELVTPGIGSSGYYSPEVLEAAGRDRVWPAGTQCFVNHPSESEAYDRPERSVEDMAAVLTEDAHWDADAQALVAEAQLFPHKMWLAEMASAIGMSIRASAEVSEGEIDGRPMTIIDRLVEGISVDFVTKAGRGGSSRRAAECRSRCHVPGRRLSRPTQLVQPVSQQMKAREPLVGAVVGG